MLLLKGLSGCSFEVIFAGQVPRSADYNGCLKNPELSFLCIQMVPGGPFLPSLVSQPIVPGLIVHLSFLCILLPF